MANYEALKEINKRSKVSTEICDNLRAIVVCLNDDYLGRKWETTRPAPDLTGVYEQVKEVLSLFEKRDAMQKENTKLDVVFPVDTYQSILGKLLSAKQTVERTNFDWNFDEDNDVDHNCLFSIAEVGKILDDVLNLML